MLLVFCRHYYYYHISAIAIPVCFFLRTTTRLLRCYEDLFTKFSSESRTVWLWCGSVCPCP